MPPRMIGGAARCIRAGRSLTMHDIDLILTLTAGLTAALVLGFITQRLRLSPIVGYILAGVVIGGRATLLGPHRRPTAR